MATTYPKPFRRLGISLALAALASGGFAQQSRYRPVEIGDLGGVLTYATCVNSFGVVVGNAQYADGHLQAFIWDAVSGIRRVDPFVEQSSALAINDRGEIAGAILDSDGFIDAAVWKGIGPAQAIAWASNGAVATAINNKGQVVGYREDGIFTAIDQAFKWPPSDPESAWDDLFGPDHESFATGINDRGQIVGYVDQQAFLLDPNRGLQILAGDPASGPPATAVAINKTGEVLMSQFGAAKLFKKGRTATISGPGPLFPLALNDRGEVVGYSGLIDHSAFLWSAREGFRQLDSLVNAPGWQIISASSINRSGMIAGSAIHNGRRTAVLLIPLKSAH